MNGGMILDQADLRRPVIGSLDHVSPAQQMRAIHAAMQEYFEAKDWLAERSRQLAEPLKQQKLNWCFNEIVAK